MARTDLPLTTPKSKRRREELLAAAKRTFEELGYFETRVADIAKAAHVSHGTFYTYFDSKDDVLRELVDALADDLFRASAQQAVGSSARGDGPHPSPFDTLEATIRTFMYAYRDRAGMIRILEQATASSDEFLAVRQEIRRRFGARLEAVLKIQLGRHESAGPASRLDPTIAAYALGGMVEDFARGCYVLQLLMEEDAAIDTLAIIWARAVGLPQDS